MLSRFDSFPAKEKAPPRRNSDLMEVMAAGSAETAPDVVVEPTVRDRIPVYDFLRGVAILGILAANLPWYGIPMFATLHGGGTASSGSDAVVEAWTLALVTGKFRSLLALLFGVGIWLQYQKRRLVPGSWPGRYRRRLAILAAFGLAHGFLIWHGDILLLYAGIAFLASLMAGSDDRLLRAVAIAVSVLAVLGGIALFILRFVPEAAPSPEAAAGISRAAELQTFAQGSYLDQLGMRATMFASFFWDWLLVVPFLLGLFTIGILLGRHRILESPNAHPKIRNRILIFGLGVGLTLNLVAGALHEGPGAIYLESATEILFGPLLAVGLAMLLAMVSASCRLGAVERAVAKVGRTALSCYILQSLLCTAFFYSWGGGYFGRLGRVALLAVGAAVVAANLVFADLWLRRFHMGPLEWLWRSLSEGRRFPLRREGAL